MEQHWYVILMNKKVLETGIYFFSPVSIMEGTLEETETGVIFIDTMGNEYLSINDPELIFSDTENCVGYGILKEELLEKYASASLEEAKANYFEDMRSISHLGFYRPDKDRIEVLPIDLQELYETLNNANDQALSTLAIPEEDGYVEEENEMIEPLECVVLEKTVFDGLLESKTYDEIMEKLQKIHHEIQLINQNGQSENDILKKLEDTYQIFNEAETLEEIKEALTSLKDNFTELIVKIAEGEKTEKTEKILDCLNLLVNSYEVVLEIDDIEKIRKEILKLKETSQKCIMEIDQTCDEEKEESKNKNELLNVRKIKSYFDQVIIGQEDAKKDVISAIVMNKLADDPHAKNSCLLVGPTGSGKTLIAETVSKYFDMPIEIIDTTQLTVPGYVGANIEDFLIRLLGKTDGNIQKAEEGIVVFDEIDKKGSKENDDISGRGVLNTLLSFIQGTTYNLKYNGRVVPFNTSKLTIFATGAFTDVAKAKKEDKVSDSYSNSKMGFNARLEEKKIEEDMVYEKLETEDFVKYGNMPIELMGRFSTIAQLSGHTKESLKKILTESLNSPLLAEQTTLAKANIFIFWEEDYVDAVAEKALMAKEGTRALKKIVEETIKIARWEALSYLGEYSGIHLIAETVKDNSCCELIGNDGSVYQLKEILEESKVLKREKKC